MSHGQCDDRCGVALEMDGAEEFPGMASTVWRGEERHSGVACHGAELRGVAAWSGTAAWCGGAWRIVAWCGVQWRGMAWRGKAWRGGLAWPGLAWPGLAWPGLAWPGLAWLGLAWLGLAWRRQQHGGIYCMTLGRRGMAAWRRGMAEVWRGMARRRRQQLAMAAGRGGRAWGRQRRGSVHGVVCMVWRDVAWHGGAAALKHGTQWRRRRRHGSLNCGLSAWRVGLVAAWRPCGLAVWRLGSAVAWRRRLSSIFFS